MQKSKEIANLDRSYQLTARPLEKARIAYGRHIRNFPNDHTADHARIRTACLNLPEYGGENIRHARELLHSLKNGVRYNNLHKEPPSFGPPPEESSKRAKLNQEASKEANAESDETKLPDQDEAIAEDSTGDGKKAESGASESSAKEASKDHHKKKAKVTKEITLKANNHEQEVVTPLPPEAIHLAWGCEVASFAQHERTDLMVEKVREFAKLYPNSRFFNLLIEPVRETQSKKLYEYLDQGDIYGATIFFEETRSKLFKSVTEDLAVKLFEAYVDIFESAKAEEFYSAYVKHIKSDFDRMRVAVFTSERSNVSDEFKLRNQKYGEKLAQHKWTVKRVQQVKFYLDRIINSPHSEPHYKWILNLSDQWTAKNSKMICDITYPALSTIAKSPTRYGFTKEELNTKVLAVVDKYLAELVQYDTFCGYSFLELEQSLLVDKPQKLFERFQNRDFIPVNEFTAQLFWTIAEALNKNNLSKEAIVMWQRLVDSNETNLPEVQYAKSRLDKRRTEVEDLWQ